MQIATARKLIKKELKRKGIKISHVSAKEIENLAKELVAVKKEAKHGIR